MRCQVFGSPLATVSNAKAPADIDQRIQPAKCAAAASIAFLACGASGQIDAAKFDPVWRRRNLRWRVVDGRDPGAACQSVPGDDLAERAEAPVMTRLFVHDCLHAQTKEERTLSSGEFHLPMARLFTARYVFNVRW